jgi:biotin carboxyl carrier protein
MDTTQDADARRTIARLATDTLPRLIERLARSELGELEVRDDGWRIRLRRAGFEASSQASSERPTAERGISSGGGSTSTAVSAGTARHDRVSPARGSPHARRPEPPRGVVSSPAVGYFIAHEEVTAGSSVRRGDVIGHVDVLGVRQEVVAPMDGVVAELQVEPGEAVEYGQAIARLEPAGRRETEQPGTPAADETAHGERPVQQLVEA